MGNLDWFGRSTSGGQLDQLGRQAAGRPVSSDQLAETGLQLAQFSAVVRDISIGKVRKFVLGQAPIGGGTTFRSCVG